MLIQAGLCLNHSAFNVVSIPVRRSSLKENFLTLLCVFALLGTQVFGGITGYLCRCGGEQVLTRTDHCHGPHSEACHKDTDQNADQDVEARGHMDDESSAGDREDHTPLGGAPEGVQAAGVAAPALVSVLLEVLPEFRLLSVLWKGTASWKERCRVAYAPPPGVVVRQSVVLLV